MADFFISYNSADVKKAEWIACTLREAGYFVRFAQWEIGVGGDIAQWMANARLPRDDLCHFPRLSQAASEIFRAGARRDALARYRREREALDFRESASL